MPRPALIFLSLVPMLISARLPAQTAAPETVTVLHAAHLLDVAASRLVSPGEVLIRGNKIAEVGSSVNHPAGATTIDLGDTTLMPGLIDAHVHLFLHGWPEDLQTIQESVPTRTIFAELAARDDLMAGYTAERDMGTEGAGSADSAVRDAIDKGLIPGPRMRVSGNAISILGGHEDAISYNPASHIPSNADYANNATELVATIREQLKEGADFIKIYETGAPALRDGKFWVPYQYTQDQLAVAVAETARMGTRIGVHCEGEPGALYAVNAGVASIDHADELSPETMRIMQQKQIYAVPTFTIQEFFATHPESPDSAKKEKWLIAFHISEFKKQLAAGVPMAVGSDVGPFPHGTQARELELMVENGMSAPDVLKADLIHGARLLDWENEIGQLKPGFLADIIAVPGNPLQDIAVTSSVKFVMKNGVIYKK